MADRGVRPAQLELEAGQARGGVGDGAVEQQRRRARRAALEERREVVVGGLAAGAVGAQHDAGAIVAIGRRGVAAPRPSPAGPPRARTAPVSSIRRSFIGGIHAGGLEAAARAPRASSGSPQSRTAVTARCRCGPSSSAVAEARRANRRTARRRRCPMTRHSAAATGPYVTIAIMRASTRRAPPCCVRRDSRAASAVDAGMARAAAPAPRPLRRALRARPEAERQRSDVDRALHRDHDVDAADEAARRAAARSRSSVPRRVVLRYTEPDERAVLIDGDRMTHRLAVARRPADDATSARRRGACRNTSSTGSRDELRSHFDDHRERRPSASRLPLVDDGAEAQADPGRAVAARAVDRREPSLLMSAMR